MGNPRPQAPKHEAAFQLWYADPERNFRRVSETFNVTERTIHNWKDRYKWLDRAAALDAEARRKADALNIKRQADMLQRQATQGRNLSILGANYFATHQEAIDNARDAIMAIKIGQELERRAEGLPDWIADLLGKTDEELLREYTANSATAQGADSEAVGK